jgi:hypothetical protein
MPNPISVYEVKIETWGLPISIRGYDETDAAELARIIFKVANDVPITAHWLRPSQEGAQE